MAKITRAPQKLFGSTGPSGDFGEFGSLAAGSPNYTKDVAVIQDLAAFLTGWAAATLANNRPALEDMNSLFYLAFYQLCYLLEMGIPEWDSGTTYYTNSYVQVAGVVYKSLQDTNLNKDPTTQATWWVLTDATYVKNTGNETIAGIKTFSSSPLVPTPTTDYQASTKKYVDEKSLAFGSWVDKVSNYGAQQAATDGFVVFVSGVAGSNTLDFYTDSSADPGTRRMHLDGALMSGSCPVKKNDYWKAVAPEGLTTIYWIPLSV